jgi:hypothetical protein
LPGLGIRVLLCPACDGAGEIPGYPRCARCHSVAAIPASSRRSRGAASRPVSSTS